MAILLILVVPLIASCASFFVRKKIATLAAISAFSSLIEVVAAAVATIMVLKTGSYHVTDFFSLDAFGVILVDLVAFIGMAASLYSFGYLKVELKEGAIGFGRVKQYFVLLHLFLLSMFFAITTTSPVVMWIAIEATTLSTAFLVSFYGAPSSVEAAWKYLLINSVGLLFAFFGTLLFLYPSLHGGHEGAIDWRAILSTASAFDPFIIKIAFVFVLIGYGTKVGLVPMHTWLPDAHSKAPAPISGLLSGVLLNVALLAILRFKTVVDASIGSNFSSTLLIFFGTASIVLAAFVIYGQKNYKRLLAYSSIEHMGIITLGFGFGGVAAFAATLHMIYHALTKSILFLTSGNILLKYASTKIVNVRGLLKTLPISGALFMMGFLSITGVPPFGIFLTELSILSEGVKAHPAVTFVVLFALGLVFVGFLRHVVSMVSGSPKSSEHPIQKGENGFYTVAPIILLVSVFLVLSFVVPTSLQTLIHSALINIYE